jgi:iron complex outermembrane receptor protein
MIGLIVKPWQHIALYANYIEGLQEGAMAPLTAANAREAFAPFVTKQYEIGAKVDFGRFAATLALYQIAQPSGFIDPATNVFGVEGEQRHRGVDFNVFGEVTDGVRLLGGVAYIDSELTKTEGGVNQGNRGPAVPTWRLVLGGEWDTPFVPGLTVGSRVIYNDCMYIDPANTQRIPDWTRLDIGARYRLNQTVIVRANLHNVLDKNYWDANAFGQITVSEPRTVALSATFDF